MPAALPLVLWLGASTLQASLTEYQAAVRSEPSLISYYTFDAGEALDTKASNHGTVVGSAAYEAGAGGGVDRAIVLNGTGHVSLGPVDAFDFLTGTGSVEAWVRADWTTSPGYNPAVFADRDGGPVNWSVHLEASKAAGGLWNGSSYQPMAVPAPGTSWHHLVVVFDYDLGTGLSTFTMYWDGEWMGAREQALGISPEAPTQLGSAAPGGQERWIGALDEVAFYSEALSPATVQAHYLAFLVGDPPVIEQAPVGGVFLTGVPLTLSASAKGAQLTYQWFKDDTAIPGATSDTLTFAALTPGDAGTYRLEVTNPSGQVSTEPVAVALGSLPTRLQQYQAAVRAEGSLVSHYPFDGLTARDAAGANHGTAAGRIGFADGLGGGAGKALLLDGAGHVNLGQVEAFDFAWGVGTVEAWVRADWLVSPGYNPTLFADRDGNPVNWSVHLTADKSVAGLWNGSTYQPHATPGAGTAWHHLAAVFDYDTSLGEYTFTLYWDGEPAGTSLQALGIVPEAPTQLGSASAAGQERWVGALDEVAFYSEALSAASIRAHYAAFVAGEPPVITVQPVGRTYLVGDTGTLSVGAQGVDLTYQWFKDGTPLSGATAATLALIGLAPDDAGTYRVQVSNPSGAVASDAATVRVIVPDLAAYQSAIREEASLISYYTFDAGDVADTKAANHGTIEGEAGFVGGVGRGDDQAVLLSEAGHVNLGQVAAFDFPDGQGTIEAWVRADWTSSPGYNPAIVADRDGGPVNWSVHMGAGKDVGGLWNGATYQPLPLAGTGMAWHHLAVVFNRDNAGSTFALYWDGALVSTTLQALGNAPDSPTQLGSASPVGQERWIGALDEVAFYAEPLGADAIQRHYQALMGGPSEPPVLAYTLDGTQLTLSWSDAAAGFTLESAPALPAAQWVAVPGVADNRVTVNASAGTQFYRLRRP